MGNIVKTAVSGVIILATIALMAMFARADLSNKLDIPRAIKANVVLYSNGHQCSGFVYSVEEKWIVTAAHCVELPPGKIRVLIVEGKPAYVVAVDGEHDVALVRVSFTPETYLPISTVPLVSGDAIYTVTNPDGMLNTVGFGIVGNASVFSRTGDREDNTAKVYTIPDSIQLSSTGIDHGSSGGMVLNAHGEVIGVMSSCTDDPCTTISWASPAHYIRELVEKNNGIS